MKSASFTSIDTAHTANSIAKPKHNLDNVSFVKPCKTSLKAYLDQAFALPLSSAISALSDLLSTGLKSHLTYTGARVITHPSYRGTYPLNDLARKWMDQGQALREADTPYLTLRLEQVTLLSKFQALYAETDKAIKNSKIAWLPAMFRSVRIGCGCCMRDPLFCVRWNERCGEALYFRPELFGQCFGYSNTTGEERLEFARKHGSMSWYSDGELQQRFQCSELMLREAVAKEALEKEERKDCNIK